MKKFIVKIARKILPTGVPYLISQHFYSSYFLFKIKQKKFIFKNIKSFGFRKISPFKPSSWKLITKKRVFNRMRFVALDNNNRKVFVKVGYRDLPTINECNIAEYFKQNHIALNHMLNCLAFKIIGDYSFCVYPFIEENRNFCDFFENNDFEIGCSMINAALDELNVYKLVHCDLNNFNFSFYDGKMVFLDYGTMKVNGKCLTAGLDKKHLGCLYEQSVDCLIYDDAKSISHRIEAYGYNKDHNNSEEYAKILKKIGRNIYRLDLTEK